MNKGINSISKLVRHSQGSANRKVHCSQCLCQETGKAMDKQTNHMLGISANSKTVRKNSQNKEVNNQIETANNT